MQKAILLSNADDMQIYRTMQSPDLSRFTCSYALRFVVGSNGLHGTVHGSESNKVIVYGNLCNINMTPKGGSSPVLSIQY